MNFTPTPLSGVLVIEPEPSRDERGLFARTWCREAFATQGLSTGFAQCSTSFNVHAHTLRGLHYQAAPHAETKLVRATRGSVYDVVVDLRPDSSTYCRWFGIELSADNRRQLYIPEGLAHGFQTLVASSEVYYQISVPFVPGATRGVRWDDRAFGIAWPPAPARILSPRDREHPDFRP